MLYLHCGWPRTSTTSLQTALFAHRDELAAAGIVYPEVWLARSYPSHSKLFKAMRDPRFSQELEELVALHGDRHILLSDENLTYRFLSRSGQEVFLRFLAIGQTMSPTTCVWTLRRFDEATRSLYLRRLAAGISLPRPGERLGDAHSLDELFGGMNQAARTTAGAVYFKYDREGAHNEELLCALGVPGDVADSIREQTMRKPLLNASLTHKQAVVLINLEELSERAEAPFDRTTLARAFHRGEFEFESDWRCELIDRRMRRRLHEQALAAARREGFAPYFDFFADADVDGPASVDIGLDALGDEDVGRLAAFHRMKMLAPSAPQLAQ